MDKKITIENKKGKKFEADVIMCFDIEELNKSYVVYKFEEEDEDELETLHTSVLVTKKDGSYVLENIKDDNEWNVIKNLMKKIVDESEEV